MIIKYVIIFDAKGCVKMLYRREFLKVGAAAGFLTITTLAGCNNSVPEKPNMLSSVGVQKYEVIFCDDEVMMVRYEPLEREYLTVNKLEVENDGLEEHVIYKEIVNTYDDIKGNFYERFNVNDMIPAYEVFNDYYGKKDYYTLEEIDFLLDNLKKENIHNKQKTLVK